MTRRQTLRYVCLALVLGLTALALAALACGPSAPAGQDAAPEAEATPTIPWLGTPPTEEDLATLRALPTSTPYPPGYVKPTDLPTFTPFPTVVWPTDAASAQQSVGIEATSSALVDELGEFMAKGNFDAVARVRVESHRDVMVPYGNGSQMLCRRQTLAVISTYQGTLPSSLDIITAPADRVNLHVDENREYIMFLSKTYVLEGIYPRDRFRREYTQSELDAFGGEAFLYDPIQLWIIDAQTAQRVPLVSLTGSEPIVSHLESARNGSKRLPLAVIESELNSTSSSTQRGPSGATSTFETPTPTPAPEARVTELAGNQAKYDGVARVRVRSHTEVVVPVSTTEWPEKRNAAPARPEWRRSNLDVIKTYRGELPETFDTVNQFFRSHPNLSLQVGQEYVLFIYKRWLPESEHPDDERRIHYNPEQLSAVGGEGYVFFTNNTWIIDGDDALLVPHEHITYDGANEVGDHLTGARRGGVTLSLSRLETIITTACQHDRH